ncbi:hypothetical protein F0562_030761 [Nyssa sinensis]|uniref:RDD domain-containing protein n=1 Tax=Nyssa sinensis TaxID=561372 RepID=A0A5J5B1S2_9ASTE|nr:hypothetical protein F0562_030761 [Nyssa sinensis]
MVALWLVYLTALNPNGRSVGFTVKLNTKNPRPGKLVLSIDRILVSLTAPILLSSLSRSLPAGKETACSLDRLRCQFQPR